MTFTAGKNVIYNISQDIPDASSLFSFDGINVSNIVNVRIDPILGEVVDYDIKFGVNTADFIRTQKNNNFSRIYLFKVKIYAGKILVTDVDVPGSLIVSDPNTLQELLATFTIKKDQLDLASNDIDLVLSCVGKNGANIPGLTKIQKIDYENDKKRYYIPNSTVDISVSPASLSSMLVSVTKPNSTNVAGAKIYRRLANSMDKFNLVRTINFSDEFGSRIGDGFTYDFIDSGNSFDDQAKDTAGNLNTFLPYEYRSVSFGFEGVSGGLFYEVTTIPVTPTSVLIGSDLDILASKSGEVKHGLVDHNIVALGKLPSSFENVSVVSQVVDDGVYVAAGNIPKDHIGSLVRRNITLGEREFSRLDSLQSTGWAGGGEAGTYDFIDQDVIDGMTYEYACSLLSLAGSSVTSIDTSTLTYIDLSLRQVPGLTTVTTIDQKDEFGIRLNITTNIPVNEIDTVLRTLQDRGLKSNFEQDIDNNRSSLQKSIAYKVVKMNLTTGEESVMISNDNSVTNFTDSEVESDKVSVLKSVSFFDSEVIVGNNYRYVVITLLRDIEQILETTIPIVDENNSYISFPAKFLHPLVFQQGTLPPTKPGKFYELGLVKNENTNPKRLLDRATALSEFELGEISARSYVPSVAESIKLLPQKAKQIVVNPNLLKTEAPSTISRWVLSGMENVDHFSVKIIDTFYSSAKKRIAERNSMQAPFSNDGRNKFKSENIIVPFVYSDISSKEIVTYGGIEKDKIRDLTSYVLRTYHIAAVLFNGAVSSPQITKSIDVTREVLK